MIKVYSSNMCPDCRDFKKNLDRFMIGYELIDINGSLKALKEFLKLRDEDPAFSPARKGGQIGIPALVKEDGSLTLDWAEYLREHGFEPFYEETGPTCSLDSKSC
ncbi:MAG: glutaredoxin [Erysipelotrichaceae bacterium]|nr:glutaredoxin [Erysipelotrichaceae bacterium]